MSDITAVFGFLLLMGIAFPGMLTAWWLLFPNIVERARTRIERTPWTVFWTGIISLVGILVPIIVLMNLPFAPAQGIGWLTIFLTLTVATLGAAGVAAQMGKRIQRYSKTDTSEAAAFVRGAVAFELAAAFPILGWAIVIPLGIITSLGATVFALLNWMPRKALRPAAVSPSDSSETQSA